MTISNSGADESETMESLLAQQAAVTQKLAGKQVTWVKVIAVTKEAVLVDVGEKREGQVPAAEFGEHLPSVAQRIPVILVGGRRDGTTQLSYKRARAELGWEAAVKAHKEKARVRGHVTSAIKGGFMVDVNGVSGFLPSSLADLRPVRHPERMLRTGVRCYIIELNESKKQVVLSRKAVLEEENTKRRAELLKELRVGEVRIGRIVGPSANGTVIDVGGLEGIVKPADVAWHASKAPTLERGTKLRVKVLSKPATLEDAEPVYLGIKQLSTNPADGLRKKYPPKSTVHGKVIEAGPQGVKIVLDDKTSAFCAPSEMDADVSYKTGEQVSAIVVGVSPTTFDVTVSLAKYNDIKDRKRVAQYMKSPPPLTLGQLLAPDNKGE
jgi:small subunit ribosomal protein S1